MMHARVFHSDSGVHQDIFLRYEHLPDFCYFCGRLGYTNRDCFDVEARARALERSELPYGDWMRYPTLTTKSPPKSQPIPTEVPGNGDDISSATTQVQIRPHVPVVSQQLLSPLVQLNSKRDPLPTTFVFTPPIIHSGWAFTSPLQTPIVRTNYEFQKDGFRNSGVQALAEISKKDFNFIPFLIHQGHFGRLDLHVSMDGSASSSRSLKRKKPDSVEEQITVTKRLIIEEIVESEDLLLEHSGFGDHP